ncbi:MAG TPA: hypothetical protein IAB87_08490, partial [Candidatus Coprenecus merdipullorum]|nr:hypothetical protein [Candidatus Coprenecus merdipullorum]
MKPLKILMNLVVMLAAVMMTAVEADAFRHKGFRPDSTGRSQVLDSLYDRMRQGIPLRTGDVPDSTGMPRARVLGDSVALSVIEDTAMLADSLLPVSDSLVVQDSLSAADTVQGMLDMPAFSTAVDSVIEDFSSGRKMIYYYGDVSVTYGDMVLKAEYMEYDMDRQVVYAAGVADTAGVVTGKPEMTQGGKTYSMD